MTVLLTHPLPFDARRGKDRAPINRAVVGVVDAIDWLDPPALAPAGTPPPGKRP